MALSNIQENLETSIHETIREVLVDNGYMVDLVPLLQGAASTTDAAVISAYKAQTKTIKDTKGFAIELYGVGSSQAKGEKEVPRIVIVSRNMVSGEVGLLNIPYNTQDILAPDKLVEVVGPSELSTLKFDVHLISNNAQQDRVLTAILSRALGQRKNLLLLPSKEDYFLVQQNSFYDLPDVNQGIIERIYTYDIPDVLTYEDIVKTQVALINTIHLDICLLPEGTLQQVNSNNLPTDIVSERVTIT